MSVIDIARLFLFVREVGGANLGLWVEMFQRFVGIDPGSSWCAAFLCFVLAVKLGGRDKIPFGPTGVCEEIHQWAIKNNAIVPRTDARPGDVFLYVNDAGHAHHTGLVTSIGATWGIAGNTSPDGLSDNGDGVHEHALTVADNHIVIIRVPGLA